MSKDYKILNEITNGKIEEFSIIKINALVLHDFYASKDNGILVKYKLLNKYNEILYNTPEKIVYNHKAPNKGYLCLCQKFGKKIFDGGCYLYDNKDNLNNISKIKFSLNFPTKNSVVYNFIFPLKINFTDKNQFAELLFQFNGKINELGGFYFETGDYKNIICYKIFGEYANRNYKGNLLEHNTIEFECVNNVKIDNFDNHKEYLGVY